MQISKFKALCLRLVEQIYHSGKPILLTKNGQPMVVVYPASRQEAGRNFGEMKDSLEITDDIVSPLGENSWEVFREK